MFERIHTKKRNIWEYQRLNDLVYIHYNLWLKIGINIFLVILNIRIVMNSFTVFIFKFYNKKISYDPIDYAYIDETEFWIIDEDEPGELNLKEV